MRMFNFFKKKQQVDMRAANAARSQLGKQFKAAVAASAVVNEETTEEKRLGQFLNGEKYDMAAVRELVDLASQREKIEQGIAANEKRARAALKSFKSKADVLASITQKVAQLTDRIQSAQIMQRLDAPAVAASRMMVSESSQANAEMRILQKEEELQRFVLRDYLKLLPNLTRSTEMSKRVALHYMERLRELPILEADEKNLLNDLNQLGLFAAAQQQRVKVLSQQLRPVARMR